MLKYMGRKTKTCFIISLILGASISAPCSARNVQFDRISTDDGLSQAGITSIVQDHKGYIWIGTQEGLNRFDGYEFKVYAHIAGDENSIANDWIWSLVVDHKGRLWVGTNTGGLSYHDDEFDRIVNFLHDPDNPQSISSNKVRFVFEDSRNAIWIATIDGGLNRFDPETRIFTRYRHDANDTGSLPSDAVNTIYESSDGTLWVGTKAGLFTLDASRQIWRRHPAAAAHNIRVIREHESSMWIGTHSNGLILFDPTTSKIQVLAHNKEDQSSLPGNLVRDILTDHLGTVWVATDNGLAEWSTADMGFTRHQYNPLDLHSVPDSRIDSVYQDSGNVLWVGTYNGLARWNYVSDVFQNYHVGSGHLSNDLVSTIAEDADGALYIGSYGGGINKLAPTGNTNPYYKATTFNVELEDPRVMALAVDQQANLWIGTRTAGLYRRSVSGELTQFVHDDGDPQSISANGITALNIQGSQVWAGTYGGGLNRLDTTTGRFTRFKHDPENPDSIGSDRVLTIYRDKMAGFWVGTEDGGLNRFIQNEEIFQQIYNDPADSRSISNNTAWEIIETKEHSLWVGTMNAGLNRWPVSYRKQGIPLFDRFTKSDGLAGSTIYGILEDEAENIWLSSNRGLSQLNPTSRDVRHFDRHNGIRGDEFNFGARLKTRSGLLVFGGMQGLVVFDPAKVLRNKHIPEVIVSATTNSQATVTNYSGQDTPESISPDYADRFVDFKFAALDYASPDKNQYLYKLDGFDESWINPGKFRRATYTNLPPGEYQFRVRASNNDGLWNDTGTSLLLTVVPPPWLTLWAYALYTFVSGGIVLSYVLAQQRKLAKEAQTRELLEEQVRLRTSELADRNTELVEVNEQLTHASMSDALTGLYNRHYLYNYLESQIATLSRLFSKVEGNNDKVDVILAEGSLFFMMIDLDGFKSINDSYGHTAGDEALIHVREVLKASTRESDIIIRWGGDEFLVVGKSDNSDGVQQLAERIRRGLIEHVYTLGGGHVGYLTGSIGFANYPFNPYQPRRFTWEQVVGIADLAAYIAKKNGKNSWVGLSGTETTEEADVANMKPNLSNVIKAGHAQMVTSIHGNVECDFIISGTVLASG